MIRVLVTNALLFVFVFAAVRPVRAHAAAQAPGSRQPTQSPSLDRPCAYVSKGDAESILGQSAILQSDSKIDCWYVQEGFQPSIGVPNNKQVQVTIFHSDSPSPGDVNARRQLIASQNSGKVRDVPGFADAAIWTWLPGRGQLHAFKGGTIEVQVTIGGLTEEISLQHAESLAAKVLGGRDKSGFAYDGAPTPQALKEATSKVQSPASYSTAWLGQDRKVRGTVSRVEMKSSGYPRWLTIYFKESPNGAFVVCSPYPDMFADAVGGDLYRMVGKTLEVTGHVSPPLCDGPGGSIQVSESGSYRFEGLQAASTVLAAGSLPAPNTKGPLIAVYACNAGKVGFDAVVAKHGRSALFHIPSAECAYVFEDTAGPASIGFGLADPRGQYVPARRIDWMALKSEEWSKASGELMRVKRGTTTAEVPAQMSLKPPSQLCRTITENETQIDYRYKPWDPRYKTTVAGGTKTECYVAEYDLNVVAYPETHEVTFLKKCYSCPPRRSSEELADDRNNLQKTTNAMSSMSPMAGGLLAGLIANAQPQALKESMEGPPEYRFMDWDELHRVVNGALPLKRAPQIPQYLAIRGTVSRVEVRPGPSGTDIAGQPWVNVYFRESAEQATGAFGTSYGKFNVCTVGTEIFEEMFGPDFRTRMIGQVLEVQGEYGRGCMGWKGSIRISLAQQVRKVSGQ